MAEITNELMYELLKRVHGDISDIRLGQRELKAEMNAMRGIMISTQQDIQNIHTTLARHEVRLDRIENRLELRELQEAQARFEHTMKSAVVQLPGLNRDRDMIAALTKISGHAPTTIWQTETQIPDVDLIVIPGGFSYGDYLRCGAIAARMPVMQAIKDKVEQGVKVIGVCNGFQILVEAGLLPGALMRNASLKFVCREIKLEVVNADTDFTRAYAKGQIIRCPVAHHDGNYFADAETLKAIEGNGQVVFRYAEGTNPNGSVNDIAGVINAKGNVIGMMPHPENLIEAAHGGNDGRGIFASALDVIAA